MVFGLKQEDGSCNHSHGAGISPPSHFKQVEAYAQTRGLYDVFPPDDLGFGPQSKQLTKLFLRDIYTKS